jgi:hypothetical protein
VLNERKRKSVRGIDRTLIDDTRYGYISQRGSSELVINKTARWKKFFLLIRRRLMTLYNLIFGTPQGA